MVEDSSLEETCLPFTGWSQLEIVNLWIDLSSLFSAVSSVHLETKNEICFALLWWVRSSYTKRNRNSWIIFLIVYTYKYRCTFSLKISFTCFIHEIQTISKGFKMWEAFKRGRFTELNLVSVFPTSTRRSSPQRNNHKNRFIWIFCWTEI